tara:strand:- start:45 stop:3656 length:3612 start_codon:yes stop_codon:yes gene_type:complete
MPQDNLFNIFSDIDEDEIASLRTFGEEELEQDTPIDSGGFFNIFADYGEKQKASGSALWDYIPDFIKRGYNESITGMAQQLATGEAPFDLESYNPGVLGDIGAGVISFFMPADIGLFAAGGGIGGQAAKVAGKTALKQMIRAGVKKEFAEDVLQKGISTLAGRAGVAAGSGAVALGTYSGIADAMAQEINDNDIDFGQVIEAAGKGAVLGAVTGGVGGRAAHKGSSESVRIAQEIASFGTLEPALDLRLPTPQDYLHASGMILGIRGANMAIKGGVRAAKGEPIIQPKIKAKEASPEFIEEYAKRELKFTEESAKEGQVWTSERKGFEKAEIVKEGETAEGLNVFRIRSIDSKKKKTISLGKAEFFKEFDLYKEGMSPEALRKKRVGEVAGLSRKLTTEEYGFDNKFLAEKKKHITGKKDKSTKDMSPLELFKYRKALQYEQQLVDIKKHAKAGGLMEIEPGKTLIERLLPEKWVQPMISAEARLKSGEGQTLGVRWIPQADARAKEITGTFVEKAVIESGLRKFKRPEEVADALEGKKVSREAEAIAKEVRKSLKEAFKQAEDAGIDVAGYIEGYFPRMMKKSIQKIIFDDMMPFLDKNKAFLEKKIVKKSELNMLNKIVERAIVAGEFSNTTNKALSRLVKEGKLSYKEAMESLREDVFGEMYSPFGNLEKKRKLKLPTDFYERNATEIITRYFDKFGRRMANAEVFGNKGEKAKAMLDSLRLKNPAEYRVLKELYGNFTGLSSVDPAKQMSPTARKLAENIMSFEYGTKIGLGFATIPNITQTLISTAVEAGFWRTTKGAFRLLDKGVRKRIRQSGATHHNVMDILLGTDMGITNPRSIKEGIKKVVTEKGSRLAHIANLLATITQFKNINYFNQLLAASTAEIYVKDLHRVAKSNAPRSPGKEGNSRYNWATRNLIRLGVSEKSYSKASLSTSNIENAMYRFAKESQLQKDILKDPLAFNNPKLRPFFIFKRFGYRQAKYAKDTLKREISAGNVFAPLRMAAGGMLGATFVMWAKDKLIKWLSGEDVVREDKEGWDRFFEAFGVVGSMGFFSDILEAEDKLSSIKFFLTPVVLSDLEKGYSGAQALSNNIDKYLKGRTDSWDALQRSIKGFAPIFGSIVRQAARRVETPGQKKKGISSAKGDLRTKIFEYYESGEKTQAFNLFKEWNSKRPSNPLLFEDINFSAYMVWRIRKLKEASNP